MDLFTEFDIETDVRRIEQIINSGIFEPTNLGNPLYECAFTELIIRLNDLLQKSKDENLPIVFTDNILITPNIGNITDLVAAIRNAICHIHSQTHYALPNVKFTFNGLYGEGTLSKIGDFEFKNEFNDDLAFFFGRLRIYFNRHIIRAFTEVRANLLPLIRH